jgi:hypothetical protein
MGALETSRTAETERWVVRGACDSGLFVGLGHPAFGCRNVGPALEKFGGNGCGNNGWNDLERLGWQSEFGRRLADEDGNGMLVRRPFDTYIGVFDLCVFQLRLGLRPFWPSGGGGVQPR